MAAVRAAAVQATLLVVQVRQAKAKPAEQVTVRPTLAAAAAVKVEPGRRLLAALAATVVRHQRTHLRVRRFPTQAAVAVAPVVVALVARQEQTQEMVAPETATVLTQPQIVAAVVVAVLEQVTAVTADRVR